jgi:synaptojanin
MVCAITNVIVDLKLTSIADIFLAVVTSATEVGNTRPSANFAAESVARIHEVSFYCLTSSIWDDLAAAADVLPSPDAVDFMMRGVDPSNSSNYQYNHQSPAGAQAQVFEHPCLPLTKILSSGSFYYALEPHWDLSTRLGARLGIGTDARNKKDLGAFDERFVWNEYIVRSLLDFRERLDVSEREDLDRCQFIVRFPLYLFQELF